MLSQGGPFDQVTGIKEIARELRCRMKHFTANLEEIRDKVEDTDRCYQLLDKVGGGGCFGEFVIQINNLRDSVLKKD